MKNAEKRAVTGIVVRERMEADEVSRGGAESAEERRLAAPLQKGLPYTPSEVEAVWRKAVGGLAWQVAFGAMLCELEVVLTRENNSPTRGPTAIGTGLQAWLAGNCPAVNYKTAMRWKAMARGVVEELGIEAAELPVIAGLLPPREGERLEVRGERHDEKRERLARMLEGRSQRDLLGEMLRGPGRPKGTPGGGRRALTAAEKTEHAWTEIRELLGKVAAYTQGPWILMLPREKQEWAARTMKDLAACFREGKPFEVSEK